MEPIGTLMPMFDWQLWTDTGLSWWHNALAFNAVVWALLALLGVVDQWVYPSVQRRGGPDDGDSEPFDNLEPNDPQKWPKVSVLIPARNEEHNIARCVNAVLGQNYPNLEVLVVDDQSSDATARIAGEIAAEDARLKLIEGRPLPRGWVGKGWALCQAHLQADGDYVILLDADTEMKAGAIATAVDYARQHHIDFLNPTPYFVNRSFWEKALQPLLWGLVVTRFPLVWVNSKLKENMAFGPFLLIRKSVYDDVEGHRMVCHDILEDVALSRLIKDRGYKTRVINGMHLFDIRMYENFGQILEGWIKTAFGAMNYNLALMTLAIFGVFYMALFPLISLVLLGIDQAINPQSPDALFVVATAAVLALYSRRVVDHFRFGFGLLSLWMHPIGVAVVQYMQVAAVWRFYFGGLTWKGRVYKPGEGITPEPMSRLGPGQEYAKAEDE